MAKIPLAGTVKTRLQPFLTPDECAELTTAFLQDAENKVKTVGKNRILAYTPADKMNILEKMPTSKNERQLMEKIQQQYF
ncbi:MAG: hypothetical protein M3521_05250 [Acidobacteriota bacterium]|nr:hypothetical protein [Acidobacteriota bacterium]